MADNGRRERVALYLAAGLSVRRAARKAGVGERTVYRWLAEDAFRQRVAELRTRLFDRAVGRLSRTSGKAAVVLKGLLDSADERVRLAAARAVLDSGMKAREALELAQKVEEIKATLKAKGLV
jgi:transposase-like protein